MSTNTRPSTRPRRSLMEWNSLPAPVRLGAAAALLAGAIVVPLGLNGYWRYLAALIVAFAVANIGFQVVVGWSGQLAMAHAAFLGLGAYATTILSKRISKVDGYTDTGQEIRTIVWSGRVPYLLALLIVPVVCACLGYLLGLPAVRLKGFFLAIATLAFAGMIVRLFFETKDLTGGGDGLSVEVFQLWQIDKTLGTYYLCLAVAVPVYFLIGRLMRGRFGRTLLSVRDADIASSSLGVNVTRYRLASFGISAGLASLAGGLYAQVLTYMAPNEFGTTRLTAMLTMIIVGSVVVRAGAVIGASFVVLVDQFFVKFPSFKDSALSGSYRNIAFGLALMLCIGVLPGGLASVPERIRNLGHERSSEPDDDEDVDRGEHALNEVEA